MKVDQATQIKSQGGFPKSRRLLRHSDFERVYQQGRRHFAAHMTVFYLQRTDKELKGARVGFTVSKALGGAVQRNRIRRRLREAVRLGNFPIAIAVDVVINPKRSALTADFCDLQGEVTKAFQMIEKYLQKGNPQ
ncbi:MAG TPA: ribonuclease P protein component [Terriglobales bacterium]|nr:ribonuclease P protein component [Terriglobales bacterium]